MLMFINKQLKWIMLKQGFSKGSAGTVHLQCRRYRRWVPSPGQEDPLEKEIKPTPVFLPENPMGGGAW